MVIDTSFQNDISITKVSGRMDATTVTLFSEECQKLLESGKNKFIIDLGGLEYISSAGLRGILTLGKSCKSKGFVLAFCSLQSMVSDIFKISGFFAILKVYPTLEEAIDGLA